MAANAKAAEESSSAEEPTYSQERLIAEATDFFGAPSHVVAGALYGARKQTFTRAEAQKRIDSWLKAEVKTEE